MDELININDYKSPNILIPKKIYSYTLILLILLIVLSSLLFVKFQYYYTGLGIVDENGLVNTKINNIDIYKVRNNKIFVIDNKKYSYKIFKSFLPVVDSNKNVYQNMLLSINKLNYKNNMIVEFKVRYDIKTGFEIIKEFILGKGK